MPTTRFGALGLAGLLITGCADLPTSDVAGLSPTAELSSMPSVSQLAPLYAPTFIVTAGGVSALNDAGDVVGRRYVDNGCGAFCLPPQENFATRHGVRVTLPVVPAYDVSSSLPIYLNNAGLIAGEAGIPGTSTKIALWTPSGAGYSVQNLGSHPGTSSSDVQGLDDQGRIVGWATQGGAIPTVALPFMWSSSTGMVNLAAQGYPNLRPSAMSGGGRVATASNTYLLGNPASVTPYPTLPAGFVGAGSNGTVVNDAGDVAHMLVTIGSQNLAFPFRLNRGGSWQQLSGAGSGNLSSWGVGGISNASDVTFTVLSSGMFAEGPNGTGQPMNNRMSPAYPGAAVGSLGRMNASGEILASVSIGRSSRGVKLTPVGPCTTNCVVVATFSMIGQLFDDPNNPGSCFQGSSSFTRTTTTLRVTNELGTALGGVLIAGRYLDDYWTDHTVTGTTDASGSVSLVHQGLCGSGAVAFIVEGASSGTRTLDRTRGTLMGYVIPSITPPTNQPPVPRFRFSCNTTTRRCTFNGGNSSDDVGVTSWQWNFGDGTTGSGASTAHTFAAGGTFPVTLTVSDAGGLSASLTKSVTVGTVSNQPPVATWSVTCLAPPAHSCTFDGTASTDADGTIVSYNWTNASGVSLSTSSAFTRTFKRATSLAFTLTVSDNSGASTSLTKTVAIP